jgi:hypothetical protein
LLCMTLVQHVYDIEWKQVIYTELIFVPDLVLHQARQTLRELIKLIGLYTKVRPHVHFPSAETGERRR